MNKSLYVLLSIMLCSSFYCDAAQGKKLIQELKKYVEIIEEIKYWPVYTRSDKNERTQLRLAQRAIVQKTIEGFKDGDPILSLGDDPTMENGVNRTPLYLALDANDPYIANILIRKGADVVSAFTQYGSTPLHYVANCHDRADCVDVLTSLIQKIKAIDPKKMNTKNAHGYTALHLAIGKKNYLFARILMESGAELDLKKDINKMTLRMAMFDEELDFAKDLIEKGAELDLEDANNKKWLRLAIHSQKFGLAKLLIEKGVKLDLEKDIKATNAISSAILNNAFSFVNFLIEKGVVLDIEKDINATGALNRAIISRNFNFAKFLVEKGADVNVKGGFNRTALHNAAMYGSDREFAKLLIEKIADIGEAERIGDPEKIAKNIVEKINARDTYGHTALYLAISNKNLALAKFLIENGADINVKGELNRTALHRGAEMSDDRAFAELLIGKCADINARDDHGNTALHLAIIKGNFNFATALIEKGADVNAPVGKKNTALLQENFSGGDRKEARASGLAFLHTAACYCNDRAFAEFLIKNLKEGLDQKINEKDEEDGVTPLQIAIFYKNFNFARALIENGAGVIFNNGADAITDPSSLLQFAAGCCDDPGFAEFLIDKVAEVNKGRIDVEDKWKVTPLRRAIARQNFNFARALIEKGVKIDIEEDINKINALDSAIQSRNFGFAKILVEKGADAKKEYGSITKRIGASFENVLCRKTPLHRAAELCDAEHYNDKDAYGLVEILLEKKADIDAKDYEGNTPLHVAALNGNLGFAKVLIAKGADVKAVNNESTSDKKGKSTALHLALENISKNEDIYSAIAKELIKKGAKTIAKRQDGVMPLHLIAKLNPDIIKVETPTWNLESFSKAKKECVDPLDDFKKKVLRSPNENIGEFIRIVKEEPAQNEDFQNSRLRVLEILADDGIEEAKKYLTDFYGNKNWKKPKKPLESTLQGLQNALDKSEKDKNEQLLKQKSQSMCLSFDECEKNKSTNKTNDDAFVDYMRIITAKKDYIHCSNGKPWISCPSIDPNINNEGLSIDSTNTFRVPFPIAHEFLGEQDCTSGYCYNKYTKTKGCFDHGWKLHISARPSTALAVAKIVVDICEKARIHYKFFFIPYMRWAFLHERFFPGSHNFSQRGKFFVIYPRNDKEASRIANAIDAKFKEKNLTREDFFSVFGDFAVGETGGIYTRLCHYEDIIGGAETRGYPYIFPAMLQWHAASHLTPVKDYTHPFKELGLWLNGEPLPDNVLEITNKISHNYNFELVMNDPLKEETKSGEAAVATIPFPAVIAEVPTVTVVEPIK